MPQPHITIANILLGTAVYIPLPGKVNETSFFFQVVAFGCLEEKEIQKKAFGYLRPSKTRLSNKETVLKRREG